MYYQTYFEYEKAKRCIFSEKSSDKSSHFQPAEHGSALGAKAADGGPVTAAFHPILLSSLLNQQSFKRDYMVSKYQKLIEVTRADEAKYSNRRQEENQGIIKYVKRWINLIELQGYFQHIVAGDERQVA